MVTNKFLSFATATGANVLSDAEWEGLASRSTGFSAGTAYSSQLNKVWRQSSVIAAMIGQFIVDNAAADANDAQSVATIQANFKDAINAIIDVAISGIDLSGFVTNSGLSTALADYLLRSGGIMTGALTLAGAPTYPLHAATKQYVDAALNDLHSFGTSGYQRLPSGLIMQWTVGATDGADGSQSAQIATFPMTFPNACLSVQVTMRVNGTSANPSEDTWYQVMGTPTTTGVLIQRQNDTGYNAQSHTTNPLVLAIGY